MRTQGWTVDDCLSRFPAYRDQLDPLLRAAERLERALPAQPSAAFRQQAQARLRARLMQSQRRPRVRPSTQKGARVRPALGQRRLAPAFAALVAVLIAAAATTGTIYAAGDSAPGEPLYPVERTIEQTRLGIAPAGEALNLRLEFAEKRLRAAEKLAAKGDDAHAQEALDNYEQLVNDVGQMVDNGVGGDDQALLDMVNAKLSAHQARLQALLDQVPAAAQAGIARAIEASKHGQERAEQAIQKHGGGKPENTPGGGKPDNTPGGGKPDKNPAAKNGKSHGNKGNDEAQCADGTSLVGSTIGEAHRLAAVYNLPFEAVRDLFCTGLTAEQVEAQLPTLTLTPASP